MLKPKSRWTATAIHFSISIAIAVLLLAFLKTVWFPGALFDAAGGIQGMKILLPVDLILGPLLTLVIYNANKPSKELARDLTVIGVIQTSCLAAGLYIIHQERPVAAVLILDTFEIVKAYDIPTETTLTNFSGNPKMLYIDLPENNSEAKITAVQRSLFGNSLKLQSKYYRDLYNPTKSYDIIFSVAKELPPTSQDCLTVRLESQYEKGRACYNINTHELYNFQPDNN